MKGHNSPENISGVTILVLSHPLMVVYIFVPSFVKISLTVLKLQSGHHFHIKISKGRNSTKSVDGVTVLVLYTSSDSGLYLYQVK